jgi:mRNA-degrading endonuclease RelE of RelBE toxin-antitoxin system
MRYTVTWTKEATDELARLWLAANDRKAVTNAVNRIESELRDDPMQKGIDFYGDWYVEVLPIAVVFSVDPDNRIVEIQQVWHR